MSKHNQYYVELNKQHEEPSAWVFWLAAAFTLAAVYIVILLSTLWSAA
jgi:hypothetical protein